MSNLQTLISQFWAALIAALRNQGGIRATGRNGGSYKRWSKGSITVATQNPQGSSAAAYAVRKGYAKPSDYLWVMGSNGYIAFVDKPQKLIVILNRWRGLYKDLATKVSNGWQVKVGQPKYYNAKLRHIVYQFSDTRSWSRSLFE